MPTSKFTVSSSAYISKKNDFICLPYLDAKTPGFDQSQLPKKLAAIKPPSSGSKTVFVGDLDGKNIAVKIFRLDKNNSTHVFEAKKMVASALKQASTLEMKRVVVFLKDVHLDLCTAVQEGALLGGYVFDKFLSKKKTPLSVSLAIETKDLKKLKYNFRGAEIVFNGVNFARDVLNEPPNVIHPISLSEVFEAYGLESGLKVDIWNEKKLEKERCEGILSVGKGSKNKPRLVIGKYEPKNAKIHLALVGKGVTFDTGGYCLKPAASQMDMKFDMAGSAMMWSAACAISKLGLPIKITVYAPLAENDISSDAYHTTDILTIRNGVSVQVNNTDAEGRLILADALVLACEQKPDYIIDSATLTGACVVALGEDIAAAYGTNKEFTSKLIEAAKVAGEYLWEMPLHMPYMGQLKTEIADCKNIGSRWGGSITAALFLRKFIKDDTKWVHMDIAGPAGKNDSLDHLGKGAKGYGVKTIVALAEILSE